MARCSDPPVVLVKWYDFTKWVLGHVDNFPKNQRFVFGQRWHELVDLHRAFLGLNLEEWVLFDDLPIDRVVHELPCELDPLVDRRRSHPSGFELLVKLFCVPISNLVDRHSNFQGEVVTAM